MKEKILKQYIRPALFKGDKMIDTSSQYSIRESKKSNGKWYTVYTVTPAIGYIGHTSYRSKEEAMEAYEFNVEAAKRTEQKYETYKDK